MTRRIVLGAAAATVIVAAAAAFLVRPTSSYFPTDGRVELGLPVPRAEPVLLGVHLLTPIADDTVVIKAVRATMAEGDRPEVLLCDHGTSMELVGMIAERERQNSDGATLVPFAETAFGADAPRQVVLRIAPDASQVTLGPGE